MCIASDMSLCSGLCNMLKITDRWLDDISPWLFKHCCWRWPLPVEYRGQECTAGSAYVSRAQATSQDSDHQCQTITQKMMIQCDFSILISVYSLLHQQYCEHKAVLQYNQATNQSSSKSKNLPKSKNHFWFRLRFCSFIEQIRFWHRI